MTLTDAPIPPQPLPDPFAPLDELPSFEVRSPDFELEGPLPVSATESAGRARSPRLEWEAVPGAASYMITCFDPDAPTMAGFWHWCVTDVPASTTSLEADAGSGEPGALPTPAKAYAGDSGLARYYGAAPPAGHGPHRYYFTVTALSTAELGAPGGSTPTRVQFLSRTHALARGTTWGSHENS